MGLPIWDPFNNGWISKPKNNLSNFHSKRNKTNNILYKHCPAPGQNYICAENKTANNGPMMVPHGLKFQYRTHIGPIWALCPDSAHMGPIWPCLLGRSYSLSVRSFRPGSFRPDFRGRSFRPNFGGLFRSTLFFYNSCWPD